MNSIGILNETSLHAALKEWYAKPGDRIEEEVDGYIIDIVRNDQLIEIQTRNFGKLKQKFNKLLVNHKIHLVYPVIKEKRIISLAKDGDSQLGSRKSPYHGKVEHVFNELVRFPGMISHPNFTLEALMVKEEEIRQQDGRGSWRRKGWSIRDRKLVEVGESYLFSSPEDFKPLLPVDLADPFTSRDLAEALNLPNYLSRRMAYCLRQMGILQLAGKSRRSNLYTQE